MAKYLGKRFVALVAIVFLVSVGAFYLVHLLPGDPTVAILGPNDTAHNKAILMAQLGLNKPLYEQYFIWAGHIFEGNFGQSYVTHQTVLSTMATAVPIDIELIVISQIIAFAIAIPLALLAARRPNKRLDRYSTTATFAGLALPPFILAPLLVLIFCVHWHIFPGPASYVPISQSLSANLNSMILPSIILAIGSIVVYFRLLRNDLIATLQEDFITMARSKGMTDRRILLKHAFRPSSVSLLASAGINIGALIAGTFVVEYLLQIPGLGYELVTAINQTDYIVVQSIVLVVAIAVVIINFIVDFLFSVVDPRIARE